MLFFPLCVSKFFNKKISHVDLNVPKLIPSDQKDNILPIFAVDVDGLVLNIRINKRKKLENKLIPEINKICY